MKYQVNHKITTIGQDRESFTKEEKNRLCEAFNATRNWHTVEGSIEDLHNELYETLPSFRLGIKGTNKKDSCKEVWGIALDLDVKPSVDPKTKEPIIGCSVARTKKFVADNKLNHIFYLSSSGIKGEDCTPHRLVLPFSQALTVEQAEQFSSYLSKHLQGKVICFDATRLWFFTLLENRDTLSCVSTGHYVNDTIKPELGNLNEKLQKDKTKRLESLLKTDHAPLDIPIRQVLNKTLVEYALALGLTEFFELFKVECVESKRSVEDRPSEYIQLVERYDVKPPDSETKDRINCHLTEDNYLIFYDRRDGKDGYSGSLLQFLLKCSYGSHFECTYEREIDFAQDLFNRFELPWPIVYPFRSDLLWVTYLKEHSDVLMYIIRSSSWSLFNGRNWEKLDKNAQLNHFYNWCIATYGFIRPSHLKDIKTAFAGLYNNGVVRVYKQQPKERYKFGFADGVWDTENKMFIEHSPSNFIWSCSEKNYHDFDIAKGKEVYNLLFEIVQNIIKGDIEKHQSFMNAFVLLVNSHLHKSNRAIWGVGDGGSGKSTMQNWIRLMHDMKAIDMNPESLFDSKHALGKLLEGDTLLLSEFVLPKGKGEFLKDIISPDGDNGESNLGKSKGTAISVDPKFGTPHTEYTYLDVFIVSQKRSNAIDVADSGWVRRAAYYDFKKVDKSEKYLPFAEVNANLGDLFVYILSLDHEYALTMFNAHCDGKNLEEMQSLQLENSVPAQYLNEHLEPSEDPIPLNQIWKDFESRKGSEYGTPNYTKKKWREGLEAALGVFGVDDQHKTIQKINGHFYLYYRLKNTPIDGENQNGKHEKIDNFGFNN